MICSTIPTKPFCPSDEAALKQTAVIKRTNIKIVERQMIETVTAMLGLLSVAIFLAHAIDAYRVH